MKELVEFIITSLVDNPDEVKITEVKSGASTIVEVAVASEDMGRVIGKGGRVINAIRTVTQIAATKQGTRISIELIEPEEFNQY